MRQMTKQELINTAYTYNALPPILYMERDITRPNGSIAKVLLHWQNQDEVMNHYTNWVYLSIQIGGLGFILSYNCRTGRLGTNGQLLRECGILDGFRALLDEFRVCRMKEIIKGRKRPMPRKMGDIDIISSFAEKPKIEPEDAPRKGDFEFPYDPDRNTGNGKYWPSKESPADERPKDVSIGTYNRHDGTSVCAYQRRYPINGYDCEVKKRALQLANEIGVTKAAKEIGCSTSSIYRWRKQLEESCQKGVNEKE